MPAGWWSYGLVLLTTPVPLKSLIWRPRRRRRRAMPQPQYPRPPADRARRCPRKRRPRQALGASFDCLPERLAMTVFSPSLHHDFTISAGIRRPHAGGYRRWGSVYLRAARIRGRGPVDGWQGRRRRHDACAPSPASRSLRYISGMSRSWSWSLAQTTGLPAASERGTSRMRWFLDPRNCRRESCWSLR